LVHEDGEPPRSHDPPVPARGRSRRWPGRRAAHALTAGALPPHHRDPFDRLLIAQAQLEGLTIVTSDAAFDAYDVRVLDARA
jgi:predicted nucleic acid-binding protein